MDNIEDIKKSIQELAAIRRHLSERDKWSNPLTYGLPDLLRKCYTNESEEDFVAWRRDQLEQIITQRLKYEKDGSVYPIFLIPQMLDFVYDLFYRKTSAAIVWKSRGSGGSLMAAIVIWLCMFYRKMSWLNFAGAQEQSKAVYNYTKSFWGLFPGMKTNLVKGKPLLSKTELDSGVRLRCIWKENQAVSQHDPGFCVLPGTPFFVNGVIKNIEDIKEGDAVITRIGAGTVKRCLSRDYDGIVVRLQPVGTALFYEVTEDHRVWAVSCSKKKLVPMWIRAGDLTKNDLLVSPQNQPTGFGPTTINDYVSTTKNWCDGDWVYAPIQYLETSHYIGRVFDLTIDGDPSFTAPYFTIHNCSDESCVSDPVKDKALNRSMQGVRSEKNSMIILLSTMHHARGLFVTTWDSADEKGFTKYSWNIYDCAQKCTVGLEHATEDDPDAVEAFCKKECILCEEEDVLDDDNRVVGRTWVGCLGKCRKSTGWVERDTIISIKKSNLGTQIFPVEFENRRLRQKGPVFTAQSIKRAIYPRMQLDANRQVVVGIDWGLGQCAMVLVGRWIGSDSPGAINFYDSEKNEVDNGIGVYDARFMSNQLVEEVILQIGNWQELLGRDDIKIFADGSHNYNNSELAKNGLRVKPVHFGRYKERGYQNLQRWFARKGIRLHYDEKHPNAHMRLLINQCENLRRGDNGKIMKNRSSDEQGDHGPDALISAALAWIYTNMYDLDGDLIKDDIINKSLADDGSILIL